MKEIAIYGAGGFGKEIYCLIQEINRSTSAPVYHFIGYFDDGKTQGDNFYHGTILGGLATLNEWKKPLCIAVAIGSPQTLKKLSQSIINPKVEFPNLIAPDFRILDAEAYKMGKGNLIFSKCSFSCDVKMGDFNILNSLIAVGHDSQIGNCNVFMPGAKISGGTQIGDGNLFGIYSVILQNVCIGNNTVVGTSSVIMRNTEDAKTYIGNPAKKFNF